MKFTVKVSAKVVDSGLLPGGQFTNSNLSIKNGKLMRSVWIATCTLATLTQVFVPCTQQVLALDPSWGSDFAASTQGVSIPSTDVLVGTRSVIPTIIPNLSTPEVQSVEFSSSYRQLRRGIEAATTTTSIAIPSSRSSSPVAQANSPIQRPIPHRFVPGLGSFVGQPQSMTPGLAQTRSADQIRLLQDQIRSYQVAPESYVTSPAVTLSNPSAFGVDGNRIFVGASLQARTRYTGSGIFGRLFNRSNIGRPDGSAGFGIGLGDAGDSVGLQVSYTAASFGGSRPLGSGGINAKLHARFNNGWAAAIGGDGIVNFGRLPEGSPTTFNDFENTYYGVVSKAFPLRANINDPFSRLILTAGAGSGRFRSLRQVNRREFGIGAFGSVAVRALPNVSLITEWTGQDIAAGMSVVPFQNIPLVITPAIRDLAGRGVGGPRFVIGLGGSIGDAFSLLDWIL